MCKLNTYITLYLSKKTNILTLILSGKQGRKNITIIFSDLSAKIHIIRGQLVIDKADSQPDNTRHDKD